MHLLSLNPSNIKFFLWKNLGALGIKRGPAGWEVQTLPLCYADPPVCVSMIKCGFQLTSLWKHRLALKWRSCSHLRHWSDFFTQDFCLTGFSKHEMVIQLWLMWCTSHDDQDYYFTGRSPKKHSRERLDSWSGDCLSPSITLSNRWLVLITI